MSAIPASYPVKPTIQSACAVKFCLLLHEGLVGGRRHWRQPLIYLYIHIYIYIYLCIYVSYICRSILTLVILFLDVPTDEGPTIWILY